MWGNVSITLMIQGVYTNGYSIIDITEQGEIRLGIKVQVLYQVQHNFYMSVKVLRFLKHKVILYPSRTATCGIHRIRFWDYCNLFIMKQAIAQQLRNTCGVLQSC